MFRVLQNLPQRLFKSHHGHSGVYWANRGQPVAESQRRKYQDNIIVVSYPSHDLDASLHTSSRLEKIGHQGSSDEEWKRSFKQRIEWDSFRRSSYASEALGWGSIIVLGLQLGRFFSAGSPGDNRRTIHESLLSSIAHVLPCPYSSSHVWHRRSILSEEETSAKRSKDTTRSASDESSSYLSNESSYWDYKPSDGQADGLFKTSEKKSSPSSSSSVSSSSYVPLFSHSTNDPSISSSSIPTNIPPSSSKESKSPFDQVTRQCWGRVNNIIGGHLMSEGEEEKAVHHFKIASESGYSKGQYNLGMCYELGKGVVQDDTQAAVFFDLAAQQGHSQAQYKLGTYHLDGRGNVEPCEQTALTLITQAAEGDVVQAQSYLGMYYMTGEEPDPEKAVTYLQAAAQQKDPEAQYHLGLCYEYGWGVDTNQARASSLYHSAASKDHAPSLYSLGLFHEQGLGGLPENPSHAKELFIRASSLGYEKATEKLLEMDSEERELHRSRLRSNSTLSSDSLSSWATSSESGSESARGGESLLTSSSSSSSIDSEISVCFDAGAPMSLTPWASSSESGSESAGVGQTLLTSSSSSSIESDMSVCFDARAPMCLDWRDVLPHTNGSMHVSFSAPELTSKKNTSMVDGRGDVNSILHSLSQFTFPTLHQEWKVRGQGGQSDGEWTLGPQSLSVGVSGGQDPHPSQSGRVVFQLGGLDEEDNVDWCEPIAQQRLVSFKRATAFV